MINIFFDFGCLIAAGARRRRSQLLLTLAAILQNEKRSVIFYWLNCELIAAFVLEWSNSNILITSLAAASAQ